MNTYKFEIIERITQCRTVTVEAETIEEAKDLALTGETIKESSPYKQEVLDRDIWEFKGIYSIE